MDDLEKLRLEYNALRSCEHANTEPRKRQIADGRTVLQKQCLDCGAGIGSHLPQRSLWGIKEFDLTKTARFEELRQLIGEEVRALELQEHVNEYRGHYLLAEGWRRRADQVLQRDQYRCQAMVPGECIEKATQVHHLRYDHMDIDNPGMEPMFDLASICSPCHRYLHPDKK